MNILFSLLLTSGIPDPSTQWAFVAESGPIPFLHVEHNGVDLGRCAQGTMYYNGVMTFVPDAIFSSNFQ